MDELLTVELLAEAVVVPLEGTLIVELLAEAVIVPLEGTLVVKLLVEAVVVRLEGMLMVENELLEAELVPTGTEELAGRVVLNELEVLTTDDEPPGAPLAEEGQIVVTAWETTTVLTAPGSVPLVYVPLFRYTRCLGKCLVSKRRERATASELRASRRND